MRNDWSGRGERVEEEEEEEEENVVLTIHRALLLHLPLRTIAS